MKLVLCRNSTIGSLALRAYMGSRWSHSAIWDDEAGTVTDSTLLQGGVRQHAEGEWFAHYPDTRVIDLDVADLEGARTWLLEQVGKGYDWSALVGILFRTGAWEDDDRWFCSELAEAFRTLFDRRVFREQLARVTPYMQDSLA